MASVVPFVVQNIIVSGPLSGGQINPLVPIEGYNAKMHAVPNDLPLKLRRASAVTVVEGEGADRFPCSVQNWFRPACAQSKGKRQMLERSPSGIARDVGDSHLLAKEGGGSARSGVWP
jgi:hypothetical protein